MVDDDEFIPNDFEEEEDAYEEDNEEDMNYDPDTTYGSKSRRSSRPIKNRSLKSFSKRPTRSRRSYPKYEDYDYDEEEEELDQIDVTETTEDLNDLENSYEIETTPFESSASVSNVGGLSNRPRRNVKSINYSEIEKSLPPFPTRSATKASKSVIKTPTYSKTKKDSDIILESNIGSTNNQNLTPNPENSIRSRLRSRTNISYVETSSSNPSESIYPNTRQRVNMKQTEPQTLPIEENLNEDELTIAERQKNRRRAASNRINYSFDLTQDEETTPTNTGAKDPDFQPDFSMDDDDFRPNRSSRKRKNSRSLRKRKRTRLNGSRSPSRNFNDDDEYIESENYSDEDDLRNEELFEEEFEALEKPDTGIIVRQTHEETDSDDQIKLRDREKMKRRRAMFSKPKNKQKNGLSREDRYDQLVHLVSQYKKSPSKSIAYFFSNNRGNSLFSESFDDLEPKKLGMNFDSSSSDSDNEIFQPGGKNKTNEDRYSHLQPLNKADFDSSGKKTSKESGDIDPLSIEENITFDSIGGLDEHILEIKEMVILPMMYPEIFQKFHLNPPKGVIFCGPPGCGKTLMARAIANMCKRSAGKPIAFFMRKGADILSKWVGEAEKQLRMLFEQAAKMQPSIIFFDEIDGLAPVRSSKQDYIHSSIVSTLLALMDGLDNRGQVILIGATNRVDAIDPALRRPGRFDRELYFKLPDEKSRKKILEIHTKHWDPAIPEDIKDQIARKTVGYCGADIKALCAETALRSLRRTFPQIYENNNKLLIDLSKIRVEEQDFNSALMGIVPSYHRSTIVHSSPLPPHLHACLSTVLEELSKVILKIFPIGNTQRTTKVSNSSAFAFPIHRPWLLLYGEEGMGQSEVSKSILHSHLSNLPMISLSYQTLMSSEMSNRSVEASLIDQVSEAKRQAPSVLYLPNVDEWWTLFTNNPSIIYTLTSLLIDIPSETPVFLLATSSSSYDSFPEVVKILFSRYKFVLKSPEYEQRKAIWQYLIQQIRKNAHSKSQPNLKVPLPELPRSVENSESVLNDKQLLEKRKQKKKLWKEEEKHIRDLRITLRDCVIRILGDRRFHAFRRPSNHHIPVDDEEPRLMYVLDILEKLEDFEYTTVESFMEDFREMVQNAEHYHPKPGPKFEFAETRQRLVSTANQIYEVLKSFVDSIPNHLKKKCREIALRRKLEKENELEYNNKSIPSNQIQVISSLEETQSQNDSTQESYLQGPSSHSMEQNNQEIEIQDQNTTSQQQSNQTSSIEDDLKVHVSEDLINDFEEFLINYSEGFNITDLDELFSFCMGILYKYRYETDRDPLIIELKNEIQSRI